MTAVDLDAVTRALHALYHRKKADRECQYANPERCRIYVEASRDASVLASLPDDRLAEAWEQGFRHALDGTTDGGVVLLRDNPYRAALSDGDAT